MSKLKIGINLDITNKEYHSDTQYLSSSNLKLILKSPEQFYKEKILGQKVIEEKPAFDEGSYAHGLILEPEKVAEEFAIYDGWKKQGKVFEEFKQNNQSKIILSKAQDFKVKKWVESYKKREVAVSLLSNGYAEHTICSSILEVPIKVRADYINIDKGYIVDIKTTGYESGSDIFKFIISEFGYDLSAALYCQVAHDVYNKLFDFYFIVISKADYECHVYKASADTLNKGHSLVNKAIIKYKKCLATNNWTNTIKSVNVFYEQNYEILEV